MARQAENMKRLIDLREQCLRELALHERNAEAVRNKLLGVEAAIAAMNGLAIPAAPAAGRSVRSGRNVKKSVMDFIIQGGNQGVTASEVVKRAADEGHTLNPKSVSSMLSRFKREGTLRFDGERYYPVSEAPKDVLPFPEARPRAA